MHKKFTVWELVTLYLLFGEINSKFSNEMFFDKDNSFEDFIESIREELKLELDGDLSDIIYNLTGESNILYDIYMDTENISIYKIKISEGIKENKYILDNISKFVSKNIHKYIKKNG